VAIEAHEVATTVPRTKIFFIHDNMRIVIAEIANDKCVACGSCKSMLEPEFMGFRMVHLYVA
tara:strand:- start:218 stop:403 length:186 start_codon:yes stop_codon:yes gene_type:complete